MMVRDAEEIIIIKKNMIKLLYVCTYAQYCSKVFGTLVYLLGEKWV